MRPLQKVPPLVRPRFRLRFPLAPLAAAAAAASAALMLRCTARPPHCCCRREAFALLSSSHPLMPSQLMEDVRKKEGVTGLKEKARRDPRGVVTFQVLCWDGIDLCSAYFTLVYERGGGGNDGEGAVGPARRSYLPRQAGLVNELLAGLACCWLSWTAADRACSAVPARELRAGQGCSMLQSTRHPALQEHAFSAPACARRRSTLRTHNIMHVHNASLPLHGRRKFSNPAHSIVPPTKVPIWPTVAEPLSCCRLLCSGASSATPHAATGWSWSTGSSASGTRRSVWVSC